MTRFGQFSLALLLLSCGALLGAAHPYGGAKGGWKGYKGQSEAVDQVFKKGSTSGTNAGYNNADFEYELMDEEDKFDLNLGSGPTKPATGGGSDINPHVPETDFGIGTGGGSFGYPSGGSDLKPHVPEPDLGIDTGVSSGGYPSGGSDLKPHVPEPDLGIGTGVSSGGYPSGGSDLKPHVPEPDLGIGTGVSSGGYPSGGSDLKPHVPEPDLGIGTGVSSGGYPSGGSDLKPHVPEPDLGIGTGVSSGGYPSGGSDLKPHVPEPDLGIGTGVSSGGYPSGGSDLKPHVPEPDLGIGTGVSSGGYPSGGSDLKPHVPEPDLGIGTGVSSGGYPSGGSDLKPHVPEPDLGIGINYDTSLPNAHIPFDTDKGQEVPSVKDQGSKGTIGGYDHGDGGSKGADKGHSDINIKKWFKELSGWLKEKAVETTHSVGRSFKTAFEGFTEGIVKIWDSFKVVLSKFGVMIHKGAACVFQKITVTFDEAKSSDILIKLENLLSKGDELVSQFFQKVGEKVSKWQKEKHIENVDEGFFDQKTDYSQHFQDQSFMGIFKEPEIQNLLDRMVSNGVFTQEEVNQISQTNVVSEINGGGGVPYSVPEPETEIHSVPVVPVHNPHHTEKKELDAAVPDIPAYGSKLEPHGQAINFPSKYGKSTKW